MRCALALSSSVLLAGCFAEPASAATVRVDASEAVRVGAAALEVTWIRAHDRRVVQREVAPVQAGSWPVERLVDSELLGAHRFYLVLRALESEAPEAAVVSRQLLLAELSVGEHLEIDVVLVESAEEGAP